MKKRKPITNPRVAEVFEAYPAPVRKKLMLLRDLILETAAETPEAGEIEEALRWGEPSYITVYPKSGTAVRLNYSEKKKQYAVCVHCQTNLISSFRSKHRDKFNYDGNRGLVFQEGEDFPAQELKSFIASALTYHAAKRNRK